MSANVDRCIELVAGYKPTGEKVVEHVWVNATPKINTYQLTKTPLFVKGIARADIIETIGAPPCTFNIDHHGGNLSIRIFGRTDLSALEQALTVEVEKLGGSLDVCESNALVYSIHVSCGFSTIEKIMNDSCEALPDTVWYYGNVYDVDNGEPLNWWLPILSSNE